MKKNPKIVDPKKLPALVARLKKQGKKIVTTNGGFDLFHVGHLRSLETAKRYGDVLIVCLNSDASIRRQKGVARPIVPLAQRMEIVAGLTCVDYVTYFSENTPEKILALIRPAVHIKGTGHKTIVEQSLIEKMGGKLVLIPYTKETSTTKIVERIRK